jgi:hypothetical protein
MKERKVMGNVEKENQKEKEKRKEVIIMMDKKDHCILILCSCLVHPSTNPTRNNKENYPCLIHTLNP